jgi:hypothetical protein
VTGISAFTCDTSSCFGTSSDEVSAEPPMALRSSDTTRWSVTPMAFATRLALSSSMACRCP